MQKSTVSSSHVFTANVSKLNWLCVTVKVSGDFDDDYPNIDGVDISVNVAKKINETEFDFDNIGSESWLNITTNATAQYLGEDGTTATKWDCTQDQWSDGCYYECKDTASCYNTNLLCESGGGCIIKCTGNLACSLMTLTVSGGTDSPTANPTREPTGMPSATPTKEPTGEPTHSPTYGEMWYDDFVYVDRDTVTDWDDTSIWDEKWYQLSCKTSSFFVY